MKLRSQDRASAALAAVLLTLAACGGDTSGDSAPGEDAAPAPSTSATAPDHATVIVGDRTWTFSDFSCLILRSEEFIQVVPQLSDEASVKLEVSHEAGGRSAVVVSAEDDSFQYTIGEGGRSGPSVEIDGRTATLEGTFVNSFGGREEIEGSVTLRC